MARNKIGLLRFDGRDCVARRSGAFAEKGYTARLSKDVSVSAATSAVLWIYLSLRFVRAIKRFHESGLKFDSSFGEN